VIHLFVKMAWMVGEVANFVFVQLIEQEVTPLWSNGQIIF
jgi:hypothetical protein